jgi:hypothetical protein
VSDQRDVCGCHRGCTTLTHRCAKPCVWPGCLSPEQQRTLAEEVHTMLVGDDLPAVDDDTDAV